MKMSGRLVVGGLLGLLVLGACAAGEPPVPQTRTVIVYTGERIQVEGERMRDVQSWLRPQLDNIDRDPSFLIRVNRQTDAAYPWATTELVSDTAITAIQRAAVDVEPPFLIYAHLRLMAERSEVAEWLPAAEEDEALAGLDLEQAILERVSDVWLLGRSVFDTQAHGPLDELLYANERGLLREFVLATQPLRFQEERERFTEENPDWEEELQAFFQRTFERDGPGYLIERAADPEEPGDDPPSSGVR